MICDICGNEIETDYRILNFRYEIKELPPPPPKTNPFRQSMKSIGYIPVSGDIHLGSGYGRELGLETFIDKAIICSNCEPKIDDVISKLKNIFEVLK